MTFCMACFNSEIFPYLVIVVGVEKHSGDNKVCGVDTSGPRSQDKSCSRYLQVTVCVVWNFWSWQCAVNLSSWKATWKNPGLNFFRLLFQLLKLIAHCEDHKFSSSLSAFHIYDFHIFIFLSMCCINAYYIPNWFMMKRSILIGPWVVRILKYGPLRWTVHELISPNVFLWNIKQKKTVFY